LCNKDTFPPTVSAISVFAAAVATNLKIYYKLSATYFSK
jgi:hypothetical protein